DALLVGAGRGTGGGATRGALRDAGPAASVETYAQQQLAGRDTLALVLLDRRVRVEPLGRDPGVGVQRGVWGGRALRGPGAEEVVRHHVVPVDELRGAGVVGDVDLAAGAAVRGDRGADDRRRAEP